MSSALCTCPSLREVEAPLLQVDRRSLPHHQFASTVEYVAPSNPIEEAVAAAWRQILGLPADENVSIEANWFEVCVPHVRVLHKQYLNSFAAHSDQPNIH